jgi:hypothetical protein
MKAGEFMTITEVLLKIRDDIKTWVTNNLRNKSDVGHDHTFSSLTEDSTTIILDGGGAPTSKK